jgi:phosphoribosyl 1,2-cyclic phosphodiesterase
MPSAKAKIIVLGSSAIFPFPRTVSNNFGDYLDTDNYQKRFSLHNDKICQSAKLGGKDRRMRSSVAIVTKHQTILLEAGPDVRHQLKKFKVKPNAVFITHNHPDANFGLKYLSSDVMIYSEQKKNVFPGREIHFPDLTITPFRVLHAHNTTCVGYALDFLTKRSKKRFIYMTDLASLAGTRHYLDGADILLADGSALDNSMPSHLAMVKQLNFYRRLNIKKIFFTHIGHATLPHRQLRAYLKGRSPRADVTYDGLIIKI